MSPTLRGGVIGAGVFGGFHANKYASLPGVSLAAVLDADLARAAAIAEPRGAKAFTELADFLAEVDVVTVASPAVHHAEQALAALQAGKPVYVEKPIAIAVEDAEALTAEAARAGLPLAVGHQERVVFQAMGLFDIPQQPLRLEAVRHGPPSERSLDVSVVLDLMVHDLDLALSLSAAEPVTAEAEGEVAFSGGWDSARAELTFDDGFTALFDVSRQAPARRRSMKVVYPSGEVEIDFLTRDFRNTTPFALDPGYAETPAVKDTLATSVERFLMAVRGEAPRPLVTGEEATRALDLALAVERALEAGGR